MASASRRISPSYWNAYGLPPLKSSFHDLPTEILLEVAWCVYASREASFTLRSLRLVSHRLKAITNEVYATYFLTNVKTTLLGESLERLVSIAEDEYLRKYVKAVTLQELEVADRTEDAIEDYYFDGVSEDWGPLRELPTATLRYMLTHQFRNCRTVDFHAALRRPGSEPWRDLVVVQDVFARMKAVLYNQQFMFRSAYLHTRDDQDAPEALIHEMIGLSITYEHDPSQVGIRYNKGSEWRQLSEVWIDTTRAFTHHAAFTELFARSTNLQTVRLHGQRPIGVFMPVLDDLYPIGHEHRPLKHLEFKFVIFQMERFRLKLRDLGSELETLSLTHMKPWEHTWRYLLLWLKNNITSLRSLLICSLLTSCEKRVWGSDAETLIKFDGARLAQLKELEKCLTQPRVFELLFDGEAGCVGLKYSGPEMGLVLQHLADIVPFDGMSDYERYEHYPDRGVFGHNLPNFRMDELELPDWADSPP